MIFVSYSHEDLDRVRAIVEAIRFRTDYDLWRDNRIRIGETFNREIERALSRSKAAIVFWSQQSVDSDFVIEEAARAQDSHKLIPVRLDDCAVPIGFHTRQTIDLSNFEDVPPYGDAGLSKLISEINRFEKLSGDILTISLSEDQADQYEIMRRITAGVHVFVGMNSREAAAGMPLLTGLELIGFTAESGLEPQEYSGSNVLPILADVDRAELIVLAFFPTLLVSPKFYDLVIAHSSAKPVFVILFGPVDENELTQTYTFVRQIPENRIIRRRGAGFPLEGAASQQTWEVIRLFLRSLEKQKTP